MRNMEPTNLGTLCGGEERGGPILGFLCKHPDSDRLCLADVFFSLYYPMSGGHVTNTFYSFRELSARPDITFTGGEGGYYLAVAIGTDNEGCRPPSRWWWRPPPGSPPTRPLPRPTAHDS